MSKYWGLEISPDDFSQAEALHLAWHVGFWATEGWGFSHANCHLCWTCTSLILFGCIVLNVLSHTSSLRRCRVPEFSGSRQDLLQLHMWWSIGWWLQNGMVADLLKKTKMCGSWMFLECFWPQIIESHARILPQTASWCLVMLPTIPPRKKWCALWAFGPFVYNKWERRQSPTSKKLTFLHGIPLAIPCAYWKLEQKCLPGPN